MRFFLASSFLISLALGAVVPANPETFITYDGYKVFRVKTQEQRESVLKKLSCLSFDQWNDDVSEHIDIAISPDQLNTFNTLSLEHDVLHNNLGASIIAESAKFSPWKRQAGNSSWFDSYHSYEEHVQYWKDLQAAFPDNSESISSGTSYEGRDLFGLHLWGADGPGKPAVLWHGTVHAREWISTMVSIKKIVR